MHDVGGASGKRVCLWFDDEFRRLVDSKGMSERTCRVVRPSPRLYTVSRVQRLITSCRNQSIFSTENTAQHSFIGPFIRLISLFIYACACLSIDWSFENRSIDLLTGCLIPLFIHSFLLSVVL